MKLSRPVGGVLLIVVTAMAISAIGAEVAAPPSLSVDSITGPSDDRKLPLPVPGVVQQLNVKPGDTVKAGQVLLELRDEEGKVLIERTRLKAGNDVQVRAAKENMELAQLEESRVKELLAKNAAAPFDAKKTETQAKVKALEVQLAQQEDADNQLLLQQYIKRHEQYLLKAPMAGTIEQIGVREGEGVEANKPILRMVVTNPLWVDTAVPTRQTLRLKVGDAAWVTYKDIEGHAAPVEGKVIHLASVAEGASETRLVRVEIANPDMLPAGSHVSVTFAKPAGDVAKTKEAPATQPAVNAKPAKADSASPGDKRIADKGDAR